MEIPETTRSQRMRQRRIRRTFFIRLLLVAFLLIVTVMVTLGYAISRYKRDYYNNALRACDIMTSDIVEHNREFPNENMLQYYIPTQVNKIAEQLNLFIYLFDEEGQCLLCSRNTEQQADDLILNTEMHSVMKKEGTYLTDRAAGKFDRSIAEPMLCRGTTLTLTENGETKTYYLFSSSYTRPLNAYTSDVTIVGILLIVGLLLVSTVLILYSIHVKAKQLDRLLASMKQYAQGDYSQPISPEKYAGTELEEIAILAETLSSQAQRAEESSRQFVSNVSHELRTPMTIISGFVEGILDGTVAKNKRMEYLSIVSQEVQRLKMLVTSMLNLTKFDAGTIQLNYRMFTLNDTAFRTVLMFENRLEKRNITIEGLDSPPVRACADPDLIGQVVYNLVENAVKFVNDGGTITFTFADEDNEWVFAIRNTGNGISKEELPKIFERFYKSDFSRSQDKTGLGLGLDITRRIIHLHHAQILVRSEEHVYTEFEVRLPHVELPEEDETDSPS
ncbi:MAG: sensor histidine kinase [Ruminococcus sp.]